MSPSKMIDKRIKELGDWRGETVWERDGIICTGETYKAVVKMTFARAPRWRTPQAFSTPASKATPGAPSMFMRATRSTKRR
jgi:hypothetical protein